MFSPRSLPRTACTPHCPLCGPSNSLCRHDGRPPIPAHHRFDQSNRFNQGNQGNKGNRLVIPQDNGQWSSHEQTATHLRHACPQQWVHHIPQQVLEKRRKEKGRKEKGRKEERKKCECRVSSLWQHSPLPTPRQHHANTTPPPPLTPRRSLARSD